MKKIIQRLMMFIIGLPAVLVIVMALPQMHHLAANITVTVMSALGAVEFAVILGKRCYRLPNWEAALLGSLPPLAGTLAVSFGLGGGLELIVFMVGVAWIISSRIFSPTADLKSMIDRVVSGISVLVYPGVFMLWIIRMTSLPQAGSVLIIFLLTVFANDSLAWFFGMLLGAGNRGFIPASPNKSVAGFIGGLSASVAVGIVARYVFPEAFATPHLGMLSGALLGLASGSAAIIGDLAESTIKRSAEIKDSGAIIPGRGGVLDSIDSLSFAAPFFYAAYLLLF